jgi:hypothetical protein
MSLRAVGGAELVSGVVARHVRLGPQALAPHAVELAVASAADYAAACAALKEGGEAARAASLARSAGRTLLLTFFDEGYRALSACASHARPGVELAELWCGYLSRSVVVAIPAGATRAVGSAFA